MPTRGRTQAALKIYHHGAPVALSRRVPLLENMGFRVISERTFEVGDDDGDQVFIHDMELDNAFGKPIDLADGGALFEEVFLSVWRGDADNDGYNALAQTAGLWSREIAILRAYGRYLQQAGIPQSQDFIAAALNRYPEIARALFTLFVARFDPAAAERWRGDGQAPQGQDQGCAGRRAEHRRRHHHPALPQPDRSDAAHQPFRRRHL